MNKQYFKRQITLDKLGIPMDNDMREYYNYFHSLIGDIDDIQKLNKTEFPDRIFWLKDTEVLLEYSIDTGSCWVDTTHIWKKFEKNCNFSDRIIDELLISLLGELLEVEITRISNVAYDDFGLNLVNDII